MTRTPGFPVHHQLPELTQTHVHRVGDAIQPSHPLSSPSPPAFTLSQHQGLSQWVSSSHQVAKVLEFQLQHQSLQWILGLISVRMDWLHLLAVEGTLKSLLQHHSSKASILQCSAFFTVQPSHPYMTTGKTIALTRWTFAGNASALYVLSRLVIAFLPRSKCGEVYPSVINDWKDWNLDFVVFYFFFSHKWLIDQNSDGWSYLFPWKLSNCNCVGLRI